MNTNSYYIFRPGWNLIADIEAWKEALEWAKCCGCDAIMAFTTNACVPPHPPLDEVRRRAELLSQRFQPVRDMGMTPMVNVYVTMGHGSATPAQHAARWTSVTDAFGDSTPGCPCPMDPAFLEYIAQAYTEWGRIEAESVWIDDDFRLLGRDICKTPQCFCHRHLHEFEQRTGRHWDRLAIHKILTTEVDDDTRLYRASWYEMQASAMVNVVDVVTKAVSSYSTSSSMGMMIALPEWDEITGRDINAEIDALTIAGRDVPWIRTGGGAYRDERPIEILEKVVRVADPYRKIIKRPIRLCCEIENYPWVPGIKSAKVLALEMYLNTISTNGNLSLSLHDAYLRNHDPAGTIAPMMSSLKPYLEKVAEATRGLMRRGSSVHVPEDYRLYARSEDMFAQSLPRTWNIALARLGIPQAPDDGVPSILTGQTPLAMNIDDVVKALSRGAIVDAEAFENIVSMGIFDHGYSGAGAGAVGVVINNVDKAGHMATERICTVDCPERLRGRDLPTRWHTQYDSQRSISIHGDASNSIKVWSNVYDVDGSHVSCGVVTMSEPYPICILPYLPHTIKEAGRQWLLQAVLAEISGRKVPGMVEDILEVYPVWWEGEGIRVLGLSNFGQEEWPCMNLWLPDISTPVPSVRKLTREGKWNVVDCQWTRHPLSGYRLTFRGEAVPRPLSFETFKFTFGS